MRGRIWHVVEATTLNAGREAIEYAFTQGGALGTETGEAGTSIVVRGYFDQPPELEALRSELMEGLRIYNLAPSALLDLQVSQLADRDWLAEWKKDWRPVEVGGFIVAPSWIESVPPANRGPQAGSPFRVVDVGGPVAPIIIRIDPGMAFGTGTHETTRLCLKAIEKYFRGGSFLDVGTGTGILAIAAAKIFPQARVEACDTDAEAIEIAKENARLNEVAGRIDFRAGSVDEQTSSGDFVCANLTGTVIVELLPVLLGATCGRLVLSGILDSQIDLVESRLGELGASPIEIDQDGEWVSLVI